MHTQTKKTLAFVISSLRMGGAEKVASFLANHFVDSYNVILVLWSDENRFFEVDKRVKIIVLPAKMRGIFGNIERIFGLIKCFKSFRVDLAVSFIHQTNILAIIASKIARIPVIATEHSIYASLDNSKMWKFLRRIIYPLANQVTTLTKGDLENYRFLKNVCVMPNPVSLEVCSEPNLEIYKPYILSAGRMIKTKHFEELLEVFGEFSKQNPKFSLLLAGDGECKDSLQKQAESLGAKIVFLGRVENLYNAYKNAEFFALTSHREGLSNVLIESLMCGIPAVSYDCPYGPSEIIHNKKNGILVEMGNKQALLEAFLEMSQKRDSFAKNTQEIYARYGVGEVFKKWQKMICLMLNKE
ncbi:glycosyltransferase [Helicobacter pullorum]|uniref:glycosyltransferase n=1 Tax=Helicobacter pullorum TaxID=35818 RepID=UPI0008168FF1|nr:glycosyltransferase [Helicobacter pullorum]OCR16653.1 glycosyltransferase [Helicobacter pullorum]